MWPASWRIPLSPSSSADDSSVHPSGRVTATSRATGTGRATLADWMSPDHIGWSVRHVRELIPTERIRSAPVPRALVERIDSSLLDLEIEAHDGPVALHDLLHDRERDALVVLHRGEVVLEWLAPGVRTDEQHLMFSLTKSVTGLLAGALASRGLLDLEAVVGDLVPELADSAFGTASVRQLLDMEASFAFVEDYSPGPDVTAYRHSAGWYPAPPEAPALRGFLASRTPDGPHGERFRYLSPTIDVLGWVCAQAAGTTWAEAVERYLWQPAGAELGASVTLDREGTPRAAGGMSALPRDLARFALLLAEHRTDVVDAAFVDDLLHAGDRDHWAAGDFATMWSDGAYRSCWYTPNLDPDVALGIGIHGQMIYVDIPREVVVVVLSSFSTPDDEDWHLDNHAVCRTVAHHLADQG
jgi:CubicO group peptidase (beta-lactamase class C family)